MNFVETMKVVLSELSTKPIVLKRTDHIYPTEFEFETASRILSYYMEGKKKFVWMKHWKHGVYIYGNPFQSYSGF